MKLANISLSALTLVLATAAAPAFAGDLSVQGEIIGSQAKLDIGKYSEVSGGEKEEGEVKDFKKVSAAGAGVNVQYKVLEGLRLGGGLAYSSYDAKDNEIGYSDMSVNAQATYDFFKQDALAFYGLGGLSYHMIDPKFEGAVAKAAGIKLDNVNLLNYDLGLGARYAVAENVNLSLAYRFSDTLAKGSLDVKSSLAAAGDSTKFKDISLRKNELIASVGYSF